VISFVDGQISSTSNADAFFVNGTRGTEHQLMIDGASNLFGGGGAQVHVTMNPDARLLVMTTEVFRNTLFEEPERLRDFRFVIHDEVHYLDDAERGTVWEESIIHAPDQMRLVALSATIPNVRELAEWIDSVRGEHVEVVEMTKRPVPLDHVVWLPDLGPTTLAEVQPLLDQPFHKRKRMRRERRTLTAPFGGTVVTLDVNPGDSVVAGQVVLRILSDDRQVRFAFPPGELTQRRVAVTLQGTGLAVEAEVAALRPEIDPSAQLVFATAALHSLCNSCRAERCVTC
jgi:biotin carboxyl carrier protein